MTDLIVIGLAFYDIQRGHGCTERYAREQTVFYMRRKMPGVDDIALRVALANTLALRAEQKFLAAAMPVA